MPPEDVPPPGLPPAEWPLEDSAMPPLPQPPERPQEVFWSYVDLAWFVGIAFAGLLAVSGIGSVVLSLVPALVKSAPFLLALQCFLYGVIYLGFFFIFRFRYAKPVLQSLGWRRSSFGIGMALGAGVLLAVVVQVIAVLLKTPEKSPIEQFTDSPFSLFLVSVMAVGLAPFFEELVFRGFLQPLLARDLGAIAGIAITGCLFGTLHLFEYGNLWQYGLAITVVGITLGYIRQRSGSLIPSTVVHACFNSISVVALIYSKFQKHT